MTKTAVRFFHNQGEWTVWNRVKGYLLPLSKTFQQWLAQAS